LFITEQTPFLPDGIREVWRNLTRTPQAPLTRISPPRTAGPFFLIKNYFLTNVWSPYDVTNMNPIVEKYMVLVEKISNTTKAYKSFGTDVNIYRSEIHIIQLIGDRQGVHISEISRLIGVTKGTVSQIVRRLESKGLVVKRTDESNNTRQIANLTEKGMSAYQAHVDYHQQKHKEMENFLESLTPENKAVLENFLNKAHDMIEDHL